MTTAQALKQQRRLHYPEYYAGVAIRIADPFGRSYGR
jgi:hypothetical protein